MVEKKTCRISDLLDEVERLEYRFPDAVEALEAVKFWAFEESVADADV